MLHDLRFALRLLRRAPGFAAMAVLVLALGIGANTAIFSLVNAILLERLPFAHPHRLVRMYETESAPGSYPLSGPDFPDWRRQSRLFAGMTLANYPRSANLAGAGAGGAPQRVTEEPVKENYFRLLGVQPALGRVFLPGESQPGKDHVVVLGYPLWQSRFAGDPGVVGRTLVLNRVPYTVVGVAPRSFRMNPQVQLWTAMSMTPKTLGTRGNHSFSAIGRLRPGVTLAQARAEIAAIAARLAREYPNSNASTGARLKPLRDALVAQDQRASLWTLMAVVGVVLLIACANLANLLLARALGRRREMAVRLALGARRGQILRQLLAESVLLALLGAALGALLAGVVVRGVSALPAFPLPQFNAINVNGSVLAFTALLALGCGLLFGLAPALQLSRPRLADELTAAASTPGSHRRRLGDALIVGEIALAMVLVAAAGLFLQSFARLRGQPLGFNPDHLLTAGVTLPGNVYNSPAKLVAFQHAFLRKLQALPGVEAAAFSSELPVEGGTNGYIRMPGRSQQARTLVEWTRITPGYFAAMRIPIVAGRGYRSASRQRWEAAAAGRAMASLDVVVNQAFVSHFLPGQNPLGKRFRENGMWLTIQGVAGDVPIYGLSHRPGPQTYFPELTEYSTFHIELRSRLPQATLAAEARRALASLDPTLPLYNWRTMNQVADRAVGAQSLQRWLIAAFALLALLLAAAGIYGVMAYLVAARTREIGLRMALGATRGDVLRLVLRRGLALSGMGVALGAAAALAAGQLIASQLYGVAAGNPATLAAAAAVLLAASLLACWLPARRAAAVDPNTALRCS
jgi:putative ABC transport system permease protein